MAFRGLPPVLSNAAAGEKKNNHLSVVARRPIRANISNGVKAGPETAATKKIAKYEAKAPTKIVQHSEATDSDKLTAQFRSLELDSYSSQKTSIIENIDEGDEDQPSLVSEWVNEIYDYLRQLESKQIIREDYWKDNAELRPRMRALLVNWLTRIHGEFKFLPETLYLTVAILDLTLQDLEVSRKKLQLVGVTSLMIAAKYEEMLTPELDEYFRICKEVYSKSEIRLMECIVLKRLDYSLGRPLVLHFLRRNSKAGQSDSTEHTTAKYFLELTLIQYNMVHYPPSLLAAAALCLSFKLLRGPSSWTDTLVHHSKYNELELRPVMEKLALITVESEFCTLQTIREKYASAQYGCISHSKRFKSDAFQRFAIGLF